VTAIPEEAALGFQRGAADHERGRPGYPEAAMARLASMAPRSGCRCPTRALTAKHAVRVERDRSDDRRRALGATGLFSPYQEQTFSNPVRVSVDTLRARIASLSFVALLEHEPRERLLDEVSHLVAERGLVAADGLLDTPYRTHITWCRRRET
jgi:hypothetical protein